MWNKREKEVAQALLDEETAVLKQLEKHYRLALEDVNLSIRILQADEQTQSKVHRIKYQETIKKQLEGILEKLHTDTYRSIQQYLNDSYTHAFVGVMYDLHGQDVPVIAPIDQNAAIKAIQLDTKLSERKIHPSVNGELVTLYESLGVDVDKLKGTIRSEITRGLSSGMKYDDIARNVSLVSKAPLARAKTIVRTEGHRIQQASQEDARQAAVAHGANVVKQWDSTMDGDTRSAHRELDGQIREVNEPFTYGKKKAMFPGDFGDPAQDCNCRCTALTRARAALDADELATMKERAKFFGLEKEKKQSFQEFEEKYLQSERELPERNGFVEAKSIGEAVQHAKNAGVKYAYYDDMPLQMANIMNQAVLTLPEDARPEFVGMSKDIERISRVPFGRSSKQFYGVTVDAMDMYFGDGSYDFDGGSMVGISSFYKTADKITKAKKAAQDAYEKKYGRKWFFNEDGRSTPYHEIGHVYANKKGLPNGFEDDAMRWAKESGCDMLKKPTEAWAEAWAAYHTQNPALPDYIRKYIQDVSFFGGRKTTIKGLIKYDENGIIRKGIDEFTKSLKAGKIGTKISPQKQARHMFGTKEYQTYISKLSRYGDKPSYIRTDLTIESLTEMVNGKLGTGIIEINNDNSVQEFFDCDEVVGYWYDKSIGDYIPTKRVQVKYALGGGNIHIIPVKGRE